MKNDRFEELLNELFYEIDEFCENGFINKVEILTFFTEIFLNIEKIAQRYPAEIIANGLYQIVSQSSGFLYPMFDPKVEISIKLKCIDAMENVFTKFFATKCENVITAWSESSNPVNGICYMWWDIFPTWGEPELEHQKEIDNALLNLMQRILALDSIACQENALHGLSHWYDSYPQRVVEIIDSNKNIHSVLKEYAEGAKEGLLM